MIILHEHESEQICGGALINMTLPGISVPVITGIGTSFAGNILSEGSTAISGAANTAYLASILATLKL